MLSFPHFQTNQLSGGVHPWLPGDLHGLPEPWNPLCPTASPASCPGPPQRAASTTRTSSEHPTWWASTPNCCRADLKNSGDGFPTTSASIPQAYWGERRGEATGEGPTRSRGSLWGIREGAPGTCAGGQGPPRGEGHGLGDPCGKSRMTPHGALREAWGSAPPGTCHQLKHPTVRGDGPQLQSHGHHSGALAAVLTTSPPTQLITAPQESNAQGSRACLAIPAICVQGGDLGQEPRPGQGRHASERTLGSPI